MKKKPNAKLDEMTLVLEVENSRVNRERCLILVDKGMLLYFVFLIVAVLGFLNGYVDETILDIMVLMSFGVLAVAITPYMITMNREEKKLKCLLQNLRGGKNAK